MSNGNGTQTFFQAIAGQLVSIITILSLIIALVVTMGSKADKSLVTEAEARCNSQVVELKNDFKERMERFEQQQKEMISTLNAIDRKMVEQLAKEKKK